VPFIDRAELAAAAGVRGAGQARGQQVGAAVRPSVDAGDVCLEDPPAGPVRPQRAAAVGVELD